jgi:hypothetical protein
MRAWPGVHRNLVSTPRGVSLRFPLLSSQDASGFPPQGAASQGRPESNRILAGFGDQMAVRGLAPSACSVGSIRNRPPGPLCPGGGVGSQPSRRLHIRHRFTYGAQHWLARRGVLPSALDAGRPGIQRSPSVSSLPFQSRVPRRKLPTGFRVELARIVLRPYRRNLKRSCPEAARCFVVRAEPLANLARGG